MKVTVRLHEIALQDPDAYVELVLSSDGSWKRQDFSNFECPSSGKWSNAITQLELRAEGKPLTMALLNAFTMNNPPGKTEYDSFEWYGPDHDVTITIEGKWTVIEKVA